MDGWMDGNNSERIPERLRLGPAHAGTGWLEGD
jgi:hypothetical protein